MSSKSKIASGLNSIIRKHFDEEELMTMETKVLMGRPQTPRQIEQGIVTDLEGGSRTGNSDERK